MFVELVMRLKVRFYLEMSHQETTRARIFCQNQIGRLEGLLGIEVPAAHVVEPAAAHDDVLHRQLQVLDDRDGLVQGLLGEHVSR